VASVEVWRVYKNICPKMPDIRKKLVEKARCRVTVKLKILLIKEFNPKVSSLLLAMKYIVL
jgi:hypothetical protein